LNKSILVQGGDGTTIPAGMVGESRRTVASSAVALVGSSYVTLVEDTLPIGVWLCCVHAGITVSANGSSIFLNVSVDTNLKNEYLALAATATGRARQSFTEVVVSDGTKKIQARCQASGTVTGTGLDSGSEESYILAVRIG
jgi:hypothetical protein